MSGDASSPGWRSLVLVVGGARDVREAEVAIEGAVMWHILAAVSRTVAIPAPGQGLHVTQRVIGLPMEVEVQ
jgi:hypothetical protein